MLLASSTFDTILKGSRSFNAKNLESVGQRAAKLPAKNFENDLAPCKVKSGRTDLSVAGAARQTFLRPPTLTASNFEAF